MAHAVKCNKTYWHLNWLQKLPQGDFYIQVFVPGFSSSMMFPWYVKLRAPHLVLYQISKLFFYSAGFTNCEPSSAQDIKSKLIKATREKVWRDNFSVSWSSDMMSSSTGAAPWEITVADCTKVIHLNSKHGLMRCIVNSKDSQRMTST